MEIDSIGKALTGQLLAALTEAGALDPSDPVDNDRVAKDTKPANLLRVTASIDDTFGYLLVQVAKARRGQMATRLERLDLHVGQELVLLRLVEMDGSRQSSLAARLGIEMPTLSRALGRMERTGFVERRPDPEDARATRVWLTSAGRAALTPIGMPGERSNTSCSMGWWTPTARRCGGCSSTCWAT